MHNVILSNYIKQCLLTRFIGNDLYTIVDSLHIIRFYYHTYCYIGKIYFTSCSLLL